MEFVRGRELSVISVPSGDLGFGDIGIAKMPAAVAGWIVGCVVLRRRPPRVSVDICSNAKGTPLPADAQ